MIPKKMDVLRKAHTPFMRRLIELVGDHLSKADFSNAADSSWAITFHLGQRLNSVDEFFIRQELDAAGWGCSVRTRSVSEDSLVVFIRM